MYKDEIEKLKYEIADILVARKIGFETGNKIGQIIAFAEKHADERPKLKPVDLSVLIESGIDCEFSKDEAFEYFHIDKLSALGETHSDNYPSFIRSRTMTRMLCCRPRMNHLHAWAGGQRPLPEGVKVKVYLRDDTSTMGDALHMEWDHMKGGSRFSYSDIIAFEVLGLAPGFCWTREV